MEDDIMLATQAVIEVRSLPENNFRHIEEEKKLAQDANNFLFFVQELASKLPQNALPSVKEECSAPDTDDDDSESCSSDSGISWRLSGLTPSLHKNSPLNTDFSKSKANSKKSGSRAEEKKFECTVCSKFFKRRSSLSTHKLIHLNVKPFECPECSKEFLRRSDLKKHSLMHSGQKPHICPECGKMFSQSSNMLTHMRRHSGVRPFSCEICGHSFYRKVDVRRHQSRHAKEGDTLSPDSSET